MQRFVHKLGGFVTCALVGLIVAGCTVSVASRADANPSATTGARGPSAGRSATIQWGDCDLAPAPFECATLPVPIDHTKPDGSTLDLAVVRLPAKDRSKVIGPLLVNPGGPGGSGINFVLGRFWPRALTDNFDLIGFDPRGVGMSSPVDCRFDIGKLYDPDPAPRTPEEVTELERVSTDYVTSCADHNAELLPHLGTRDVAADMEALRVALGVDQLSYLGYSYGTSIGQVYADNYPTRVRAMVLDGVVRLGQPGIEAARDQGVGFERVLGRFFDECTRWEGCPTDPAATFRKVRAQLRDAPLPTDDGSRELTPGAFQLGVGQALYVTSFWSTLAEGLGEAAVGDGSILLGLSDQYLGRNADGTYDNQTDAYFAVSCLDWDWPDDPQEFLDAGRAAAKTAPYLVEGIITDYIRCAYWPTPPQPLTSPTADGSPLIVVVSTTEDPATPYDNGVDLVDRLPDATLITKVGANHTAYGHGDSCVDNAVNAYLISLRPPKKNLRCN